MHTFGVKPGISDTEVVPNILHIITTINRGGAENHLVDLVRGQRSRGLQVSVAYLKGDGYWTQALRECGAAVYSLGLTKYGEIAPLWRMRRLIQRLNPSLVHAHMPPAELYGRLALIGLSSSIVFVITKHNDEPFFKGIGKKALGAWVAKRAIHVIAISDAVKAYIEQSLGLCPGKVCTVHYGIAAELYQAMQPKVVEQLRSSWLSGDSGWVIGTVARLVPQKALHILLEGYALYRHRATRTSRLVIVGRGPLEQDLKQLASRLAIDQEVVWSGFREDIPAVMQAFDLFALTSNYEGFGLVLLEAMASSRPVVATAVSAIPEVVVDGVTGLLVPPRNSELLADAFKQLEDEQSRLRLGRAAFARVVDYFPVDKMVDRTLGIYERCGLKFN